MLRRVASLFVVAVVLGFTSSLGAAEPAKPAPLPAGKPCQGTLQISGKTYKLEFAVAYEAKIFDDMGISVLLADKAIDVNKLKAVLKDNKGSDDQFTMWTPNIKLTFSKEGELKFANGYGENGSISQAGGSLKGQLTVKDGRVSGTASLEKDPDSKRVNTLDVRFDMPLIPYQAATESKPDKPKKPKSTDTAGTTNTAGKADDSGKTPAKTVSGPKAHDLPVPKDATDIEFKKLVENIRYKSPADVKAMTAFLTQAFAKQGWTAPDQDLITPKSVIMRRNKGAKLTIFVKPADSGSSVQMMTEGLSWEDEKPTVAPAEKSTTPK